MIFYLAYKYVYAPFLVLKRLGVNHPPAALFYGNARELWKHGPVKYLEDLTHQYGPICGFYYGVRPIVVVSDQNAVRQILVKDFDSFINREHMVDFLRRKSTVYRGLVQARGDMWRNARQTISPSFSAMKLKAMIPLIQKSCKTLGDKFGECATASKAVDVCKLYGKFTMETILAVGFGRVINVQGGEADNLTNAAMELFRISGSTAGRMIPLILSQFPFLEGVARYYASRTSAAAAYHHLQSTATELVRARRAMGDNQKECKDLLQLMIDATDDSGGTSRKLIDEEIVTHSTTFLAAGFETTSTTLAFTSYLLALNPLEQEKLHCEISSYFANHQDANLYDAVQGIQYLDDVLQESLRMYSPVPVLSRQCTKSTEVGGVRIPEGTVIRIPVCVLHHDPNCWEEPEKFRPERFAVSDQVPLAHMPFGMGQRNCIGMRLALMTAKLALINIVKNYKFIQTEETEIPLSVRHGLVMSPKNGVFIRIEAR